MEIFSIERASRFYENPLYDLGTELLGRNTVERKPYLVKDSTGVADQIFFTGPFDSKISFRHRK